ncbi:TetR/AcrR family transcriptional regulator OS=Streptomyces alboniger OX=132473 GN=CP975_11160 PE=4 SV=1 [Streptomyces alboniger]
MARTKEFDPEAALQSALELFWQRGFEATSMSDLVEHLGIGRASIYATFGSEHELYLKALDSYQESCDPRLARGTVAARARTARRTGGGTPFRGGVRRRGRAPAVRGQHGHRTCPARPGRPGGSSTAGTTSRPCCTRPSPGHRPRASWARTASRRALARVLLVLMQGMRVVGKASADPARLRDAAEQALTLLD